MNEPAPMPQAAAITAFAGRRALVAFTGETELRLLKFLKPGFRHCLVVIESAKRDVRHGGCWAFYNPLVDATELTILVAPAAQVRAQLERAGYRVIETRTQEPKLGANGWWPFTCVEAIKRALGISAPSIITPWQLYGYLKQNASTKENILDNMPVIGL